MQNNSLGFVLRAKTVLTVQLDLLCKIRYDCNSSHCQIEGLKDKMYCIVIPSVDNVNFLNGNT